MAVSSGAIFCRSAATFCWCFCSHAAERSTIDDSPPPPPALNRIRVIRAVMLEDSPCNQDSPCLLH